ncbi:MAG: hypothetical protein KAX42_00610 [Sphaerotilus sp.]|nr:hypothetical protein [Sphaerotilus sp.]
MPDHGLNALAALARAQFANLGAGALRGPDAAVLESACAALLGRAQEPMEGYRQWPRCVEELLARWAPPGESEQTVQLRLNLLLLALIETLPDRLQHSELPAPFAEEYRRSGTRILQRIAQGRRWVHGLEDDIFRKDLALLCLRMLPCVSHLVCRYSGVPRSTLLLPRNLASGASARVVFALRGRLRPLIANHVHPEMTDRFDPAGREACYRLVCLLLMHWPDSAGLVGASWYYDGAVGDISPHLAYLRKVPAEHGALFLDAGASSEARANAIFGSKRRRARVEDGSYQPRTVMMVWPRRALLEHHPRQPATRAIV